MRDDGCHTGLILRWTNYVGNNWLRLHITEPGPFGVCPKYQSFDTIPFRYALSLHVSRYTPMFLRNPPPPATLTFTKEVIQMNTWIILEPIIEHPGLNSFTWWHATPNGPLWPKIGQSLTALHDEHKRPVDNEDFLEVGWMLEPVFRIRYSGIGFVTVGEILYKSTLAEYQILFWSFLPRKSQLIIIKAF